MATIEQLLALPDEELEKLTEEQKLTIWKDCFDLEKKLITEGKIINDLEEETASTEGTQTSRIKTTAPKDKATKKRLEIESLMNKLINQQKEIEKELKGTNL